MSASLTRRDALRGAVVVLGAPLMSACGDPDPYRRSREAPGATTGAAPTGDVSGRRIDFQGATCVVPERASRIVTLADACLQPALDLGAPVVATAAISPAVVPPSRRAPLRALPVVGSGRADDPLTVTDVLAFSPDLVLAGEDTPQRLVDDLGAQVPVVVVRTSGPHRADWRGRVRDLASVMGLTSADAVARTYADHAAAIRRRYARVLATNRVVVLRAWDRARITAYGPRSVIGDIYTDAGARFVPAVDGTAPGEFPDTLDHVGRYLAGARLVMLASDYAGGLDAFTGGSLANSDEVTGYARAHGAVLRGAGVLTMTSYAQAHFALDRLGDALARLAG